MRYITILITIICFWFLLGVTLTSLYSDSFLVSGGEINTSYETINPGTDINMSTLQPEGTTTLVSFVNALKTMFGFRVPALSNIPNELAVILSFINWFLLIILGISIYRLANPLS